MGTCLPIRRPGEKQSEAGVCRFCGNRRNSTKWRSLPPGQSGLGRAHGGLRQGAQGVWRGHQLLQHGSRQSSVHDRTIAFVLDVGGIEQVSKISIRHRGGQIVFGRAAKRHQGAQGVVRSRGSHFGRSNLFHPQAQRARPADRSDESGVNFHGEMKSHDADAVALERDGDLADAPGGREQRHLSVVICEQGRAGKG